MRITVCQAPGCTNSLEGIAQRRTRKYCSRACVERAWWHRHRADGTLPERGSRKGLTRGGQDATVRPKGV